VRIRSGGSKKATRSEQQKIAAPALSVDGEPNDQRATDQLARQVMGWRTAPDRFIKPNRGWIPRWRFQPFTELADAFLLLDQAAHQYILRCDGRTFTAEVRTATGRGVASGEHKPRTITLAIAQALGPEVDR
jgi:hypothetical protein